MAMRRGTKVLGPSPEARAAARARRTQVMLGRAARSQGEEAGEREVMKPKKMAKGGGIEKRGKTKGMMPKMAAGGSMKKYAKGGSIDGCATKGKTKGKMVTMAMGGKTC